MAPLAVLSLVLFLSPLLVSAGPREDREAAAAAAAAAEKAMPSPSPAPSASAALGAGAPKNASFLFTITARKAEISPDPKVSIHSRVRVGNCDGRNARAFVAALLIVIIVIALFNRNLEHTPKKQRNGSAIVKLLDPNPHVLWFTDKPKRAAGALDADLFLSKAFSAKGDANGTEGPWLGEPNAVVLGMGPGGAANKANKREEDDQAAVVTLRNPSMDAKSGAISFEAEIIAPSEGAGGAAAEEAAGGDKKKKTKKGKSE